MFWVVLAAVVVVLAMLAWWSSGRAKPLNPRQQHGRPLAGADPNAYSRGDGQSGDVDRV